MLWGGFVKHVVGLDTTPACLAVRMRSAEWPVAALWSTHVTGSVGL